MKPESVVSTPLKEKPTRQRPRRDRKTKGRVKPKAVMGKLTLSPLREVSDRFPR
jgi:hypothetical protein